MKINIRNSISITLYKGNVNFKFILCVMYSRVYSWHSICLKKHNKQLLLSFFLFLVSSHGSALSFKFVQLKNF